MKSVAEDSNDEREKSQWLRFERLRFERLRFERFEQFEQFELVGGFQSDWDSLDSAFSVLGILFEVELLYSRA